jgi:transposase
MKQHTEDYKLTAVKYYLHHNEDNAVIHKSKIIRETIENDNNHLIYSVPYHPETNSIEEFFSQLKHYTKKKSPNTYEDIYNVISNILEKKLQRNI